MHYLLNFVGGPGLGTLGSFGRMGNVNWVILGFRPQKCTQFFLGPQSSDFRPDPYKESPELCFSCIFEQIFGSFGSDRRAVEDVHIDLVPQGPNLCILADFYVGLSRRSRWMHRFGPPGAKSMYIFGFWAESEILATSWPLAQPKIVKKNGRDQVGR